MNALRTHYQNLQVVENATDEVIRGAYRYLAQKWHPDKNSGNRDLAERNTKILNEAYQVLSDPEQRRAHDAWIAAQRAGQAADPPPGPEAGAAQAPEAPPGPDPVPPTAPPPSSDFLDALRWLAFLPVGYMGGALGPSLVIGLGDRFLSGSALLSGLTLYGGVCCLPIVIAGVGLAVAPRKTRTVKWLLLGPMLLAAILFVVAAVMQFSGVGPSDDPMPGMSSPLSPTWKVGILAAASAHGVLWAAIKRPAELLQLAGA